MTLSGQRTPLRHKKDVLRKAILDAARHTMLRDGFDAVSMRKIADAIGYSPASLYLHFQNRDAIAQALCTEGHAQLVQVLGASASDAHPLRSAALAYVEFARGHEAVYRLMFMQSSAYTSAAMNGADETIVDILGNLAGYDRESATGLWATLHGIASLALNAALTTPATELVEWALTPYPGAGAIGETARRRAPGGSA